VKTPVNSFLAMTQRGFIQVSPPKSRTTVRL
jgi:hypothetical protein